MSENRAVRRRRCAAWVVFIVYMAIVAVLLLRHENWRDEAQSWLLARDLSPLGLFRQMSYEGHPCLWHLLLLPLTRLGLPYVSMNLLSLLLTATAAGLLLRKCSIPLWIKGLYLAGAPFLYWFPVISRSYALVPPILFFMAVIYSRRRERPFVYGLLIALLVQTHVIMLGMAAALSLVWLGEAIMNFRRARDGKTLARQGLGLALPLLSLILLLAQLSGVQASSAYQPPDPTVNAVVEKLTSGLWLLVYGVMDGMPLPVIPTAAAALLSVLILVLVPLLRKNSDVFKPLLITLFAIVFQVLFSALYRPFTAHRIALWVPIVLWTYWLIWPHLKPGPYRLYAAALLVVFAIVPVWANSQTPWTDFCGTYSDSRNCADYIRENLPEDAVIYQVNGESVASVTAYLDADGMYDVQTGELTSFATWAYTERRLKSFDQLCQRTREINPDATEFYLLFANYVSEADAPLMPAQEQWHQLYLSEPIPSDTREVYNLYRFDLPPL